MTLRLSLTVFFATALISVAAEPTGTVAGSVTDPSGSGVAAAKLEIVNIQTNWSRDIQSSGDGSYVFTLVPVGKYRLITEANGFRRYEQLGIEVNADQTSSVSVRLQIGSVSESVQVTSNAEMVETRSGALSSVIKQQKIIELPLDGRNAASLILLAPGAVDLSAGNAGGVGDTRQTVTYPSSVSISANGGRADTVSYNLDGGSNQDTYTNVNNPFPNPDAVEEFSVQTNSFSAEYGRGSGAVVNVVTKSGTNELHGSLFEFFRNGALNARNYFATDTDSLKRNQFGGSLGGPIIKNKLFFFGTYQGTQLRNISSGNSATVLTAAQRAGDFSTSSKTLKNPFTGAALAGNQIPASSFDPVSQKLLNGLPLPSESDGLVFFDRAVNQHENQYLGRVDYLTGNQRMYARYFYTDYYNAPISNSTDLLASTRGNDLPSQTAAFGHTMNFGPNLLNSFIFSYAHNGSQILSGAPFDLASLGVNGLAHSTPPEIIVAVSGYFSIGTGHPGNYDRGTWQVSDSIHWVKGDHELAIGGDFLRSNFDARNTYRQNGDFRFRGTNYSGDPRADFLMGYLDRFLQGGGEYANRRGNMGSLFVQDTFRASSHLVISAGLRWDPFVPFTDTEGRITCFRPGLQSTRFVNAPLGYIYAGDAGCGSGGFAASWSQLAPRLGITYNPGGGKTVIRAGAGIFYQPPFMEQFNNMADSAPFSPQVQRFRVPFSNPYLGATNPFPAQYAPQIPGSDVAFDLPLALAVTYTPDWHPSRTINWNFTVERQLGGNLLARAAYVGSSSNHLSYNTDVNAPRPSPTATADDEDARRPYQDYGQITQNTSGSNGSYNALQLTLEKRFSHGFSLSTNYTWSKSLDAVSYTTDLDTVNVINPYDVNAYRGVSDYNTPHRFILNYVWTLPSPRSGLAKAVLGGWESSGIWTWQSGFPLNITSGNDTSFSLPENGNDQAQLSCSSVNYTGGSQAAKIAQWFDTSCFGVPEPNTFGNVGRNTLTGPGTVNFDLGAHRIFSITERVNLQFRGEFFNAFNHAQFNNPDTTVADDTFGRITSARSPRIIQLALKLRF
ncbi:MAG TPA: carboxypeptidase regulatory-like domain-containing protein [Bryobacteraceae bacterium]|nr:carboxypeptidase regulatory-like domain-containing protein [Bryobacteraceae bacterium]